MVLVYFFVLIIGFYGLIKGSDIFVDGSCAIARVLRVPELIIGLTIVAMGTSAPEMAVSISAAMNGSNEIAVSNVIGSNIANLLLILGVTALFQPVPVEPTALKRDFPIVIITPIVLLFAMGGNALLTGKVFFMDVKANAGTVSRIEAAVLLIIFIAYIVYLIVDAKKSKDLNKDEASGEEIKMGKCILLIVLGLVMIVVGGRAVVYSAKNIARAAGMTETLIGLTIVALGTSLPELVTSVVAAKKGQVDLALGNVLGSNVCNTLLVLGMSALIHPVTVNVASFFDLMVCIAVSILTCVFAATHRRIVFSEGMLMLGIYVLYIVYAQMR